MMRTLVLITLVSQVFFRVDGRLIGGDGNLIRHSKLLEQISARVEDILQDEYVVVLQDNTTNVEETLKELVKKSGGSIKFVYDKVFKGGLIQAMPMERLSAFLDNKIIRVASPNMKVKASIDQTNPPWGLDRIDQDGTTGNAKYSSSYDGAGVDVYILDTGVRLNHDEFDSRASCGYTIEGDDNCDDVAGHGTHVAGIAAGKTYGVAKKANVIAVKVLYDTGYGSDATIIAGIDYVIGQKQANPSKPSVINMSLGGTRTSFVNNAVAAAVDAGITAVVAAGNENRNACNSSPASAAKAITVGSTTSSDARSSFSNVGSCVDILAPGSAIVSAYPSANGSTSQVATLSGTSMASPFVAGVAALHLQKNTKLTPAQVWSAIQTDSLLNRIRFNSLFGSRGSPNRLLNIKSLK